MQFFYDIYNYHIGYYSPAKQFITAEKMAAHLSGLHISSNYTKHSLACEDVMEMSVDTSSLSEKLKGHTIVLSDDVKKVQDEPLLPASLIERYQKFYSPQFIFFSLLDT